MAAGAPPREGGCCPTPFAATGVVPIHHGMTTPPESWTRTAVPTEWAHDTTHEDVTALLPPRAAVLDRLTEQLPTADARPATLIMIGITRRDDGRPTPAATLAQVTTLLARSVRGDDWLGRSGPAEFVLVVSGPESAAEATAARLTAAIAAEGIPGISAAAGIATLAVGLSASEVLRRATLCLTTARSIGPRQVISYRGAR